MDILSLIFIILLLIICICLPNIKVVKATEVYVIERFGKFYKIAEPGLVYLIPFVDKVKAIVPTSNLSRNIKTSANTKDGKTVNLDLTVHYKITDIQKAVYESANVKLLKISIEFITIKSIRYILERFNADEILNSKDSIIESTLFELIVPASSVGCRIDKIELNESSII